MRAPRRTGSRPRRRCPRPRWRGCARSSPNRSDPRATDAPLRRAAQLEQCGRLAGRFAPDCSGHALQRWAERRPGPEEIASVRGLPADPRLHYWIGVATGCTSADPAAMEPCAGLMSACVTGFREAQSSPTRCDAGGAPLGNQAQPPPDPRAGASAPGTRR